MSAYVIPLRIGLIAAIAVGGCSASCKPAASPRFEETRAVLCSQEYLELLDASERSQLSECGKDYSCRVAVRASTAAIRASLRELCAEPFTTERVTRRCSRCGVASSLPNDG